MVIAGVAQALDATNMPRLWRSQAGKATEASLQRHIGLSSEALIGRQRRSD